MDVITRQRPAAADEFWKLILADPDLLDEEFAKVMASWAASPPGRGPTTGTARARRPGYGKRPQPAGPAPSTAPRSGRTLRFRLPRSPPEALRR
jgi:hypothetical protein